MFTVSFFEDGSHQHYLSGIPIDGEEVTEAYRLYGEPEADDYELMYPLR